MAKRILIIDDEKDICELVEFHLRREGFDVEYLLDGEAAWNRLKKDTPDLILLDLMLPGMSGLEICRLLKSRAETEHVPIIMLTAKAEETDRVVGLELGADDYVTKPFSVKELIARIKAVLRRSRRDFAVEKKNVFEDGSLRIDYDSYEVRLHDRVIDLSHTEAKLLFFLTRHPNRVYTRDQLLEHVWGENTFVEPRTVDVHISRLRSAIEDAPDKPKRIVTVRGVGYKYVHQRSG